MEDTKLAKVLVVDDEPNIVELLTVSLKFQNFEVYSANSGNEALRTAREVNPDIEVISISTLNGEGMDTWINWLKNKHQEKKEKNSSISE